MVTLTLSTHQLQVRLFPFHSAGHFSERMKVAEEWNGSDLWD